MRFGIVFVNRSAKRIVIGLSLAIWMVGAEPTFAAQAAAPSAGVGEMVGTGIARYRATDTDPAKLPPSLALRRPLEWTPLGPVEPDAIKARPLFWKSTDERYCVRIDIEPGTSLYGTGEVAGPLLRNGRKIVAWNTDAYGYTEENPSLYQSHPWVLAVRRDGTAFGVLADTTWRCEIDLTGTDSAGTGSIVFRGEGSPYNVWVIDRATPQEVVKGLSELVGTIPLPPRWAIGYHQCRYSYYPESRVREIAKGFRDRKIPCDVIWFDIDYMDQFKVFTFDKNHFPDPKGLNQDLENDGFKCIWMIDPGVKDEAGYSVRDQMVKKDYSVKTSDGKTVYRGEVWPGWCVFPDYTRPDVRAWWQTLYTDFMAQGIDGVWNDMNEPAVFNVKSKTMPEDNIHAGGAWDYGGVLPAGPHLQYHNVYGMLMAKGTFDGIATALPTRRPFVLTRAGYIGSHRYAATWTGDNSAEWDDLEASIPMAINLGLSAQPFSGPDIGGFNGNGDGKMFARWMGIGALLPFSRGHTGKGNIDKEPWSFGVEVEHACRLALERRYRLMPYLYTLFEEASRTGLPVLRPVFFADPTDMALRSEDDAFMLGDDLLVVPRVTPERDRQPVMPKGNWQRVYLVNEGDHPDLPALYTRAGSIIPAAPVKQSTSEVKDRDHLHLIVALDENNRAIGRVYEDDGDNHSYRDGHFRETVYVATLANKVLKVEILSESGDRPRSNRQLSITVVKDGWYSVSNGQDGVTNRIDLSNVTPVKFQTQPPSPPVIEAPVPKPS